MPYFTDLPEFVKLVDCEVLASVDEIQYAFGIQCDEYVVENGELTPKFRSYEDIGAELYSKIYGWKSGFQEEFKYKKSSAIKRDFAVYSRYVFIKKINGDLVSINMEKIKEKDGIKSIVFTIVSKEKQKKGRLILEYPEWW